MLLRREFRGPSEAPLERRVVLSFGGSDPAGLSAPMAEALLRDGEHQRAADLCERALRFAPGYKRAHYNLGLAYRGLGRKDEAADELNKGLEAKKKAAVAACEEAVKGTSSRIQLFNDYYPAGDEYELVHGVSGRLIPPTGLPKDVGCLVQNVESLNTS